MNSIKVLRDDILVKVSKGLPCVIDKNRANAIKDAVTIFEKENNIKNWIDTQISLLTEKGTDRYESDEGELRILLELKDKFFKN